MNLDKMTIVELRILANERASSGAREAARSELRERGVAMTDPKSPDGQALAGMMAGRRRGTSAPCVRRDGRVQTFGGTGDRPAAHDKSEMDARMGRTPKEPGVRRDGRVQTFETLTAADARRMLATKKDGAQ